MAMFQTICSFNAGELSEKMKARVDVSQYGKGCKTVKNFLVRPYGSVEKRPGTLFVANTKETAKAVRLIPFVFSTDTVYICEFGDNYIRFYRNRAFVMELSSIYPAAAVAGIKYVQCADVMYLAHPSYPVQVLKRTSATVFEISTLEWAYPPVLDPNLDDGFTITPSGVSGNITLAASKDLFLAGHKDAYFELIHIRRQNSIDGEFSNSTTSGGEGTSTTLEVKGFWTFTTHGTWTGNVAIQRSYDNGSTWGDYRVYSSSNDSNVSTSGEEEDSDVLYRIHITGYSQSSTGTIKKCVYKFVNPDFRTTGVVQITAVTDARNASATVIKKLGEAVATNEWNEGAFSGVSGYPCAIAFFEERLFFGGIAKKPQTIWGSKTNDWNNFLDGTKDDDAISFTLASDTVNEIEWLVQHDNLIIGTSDSEWTLGASNKDEALTASNFHCVRQSVYGSAPIAARMAGEVVLFVQRQARKVREFCYSYEKDGFVSPDLTILADHITEGGVVETALTQQPDTLLWCLLSSGTIAALTYERDQEVCGWQRIVTDGAIQSICAVPGTDGDTLYWIVVRNGKRMIEEMAPRTWSDTAHCIYLDSAVVVDNGDDTGTVVSGLNHLEGKTVDILADGYDEYPAVVSGGTVTIPKAAHIICAGLPVESEVSPMPIEFETQNGLSLSRKKRICELRLMVYGSIGGEARSGDCPWQKVISRDVLKDDVDKPISPKTETVRLETHGGYNEETNIEVRHDLPLPFNLAAITAVMQLTE